MTPIARVGDLVQGGAHCHGHSHAPVLTPGLIIRGATKVFAGGMPVARTGDEGHSPSCCGGIGKIVLQQSQSKVFAEGQPVVGIGTPTLHCGMAPGSIENGYMKVLIP